MQWFYPSVSEHHIRKLFSQKKATTLKPIDMYVRLIFVTAMEHVEIVSFTKLCFICFRWFYMAYHQC